MVKYINFGHHKHGTHMYVITMFKTDFGNYKVEIIPCDIFGNVVSEAVAWDIFPTWWSALKYVCKQYKEFYYYVNGRR